MLLHALMTNSDLLLASFNTRIDRGYIHMGLDNILSLGSCRTPLCTVRWSPCVDGLQHAFVFCSSRAPSFALHLKGVARTPAVARLVSSSRLHRTDCARAVTGRAPPRATRAATAPWAGRPGAALAGGRKIRFLPAARPIPSPLRSVSRRAGTIAIVTTAT